MQPQEGPTASPQECLARVTFKQVPQECVIVCQECLTAVPSRRIAQRCPASMFGQKRPARLTLFASGECLLLFSQGVLFYNCCFVWLLVVFLRTHQSDKQVVADCT